MVKWFTANSVCLPLFHHILYTILNTRKHITFIIFVLANIVKPKIKIYDILWEGPELKRIGYNREKENGKESRENGRGKDFRPCAPSFHGGGFANRIKRRRRARCHQRRAEPRCSRKAVWSSRIGKEMEGREHLFEGWSRWAIRAACPWLGIGWSSDRRWPSWALQPFWFRAQ